jgi:hypothetical protein
LQQALEALQALEAALGTQQENPFTAVLEETLPSVERWLQVKAALGGALGRANATEVRVIAATQAPESGSEMVIADEYAFLAFDDDRTTRPTSGLEFGAEVLPLLRDHFDRLWHDPRAICIKSYGGVNHDAVQAVDAALASR